MEHGGNLYRVSRETGIPETAILDFSVSINPLGVPSSVTSAIESAIRDLPNYPEVDAEPLASHLGSYLDVDRDSIICGNGSTELIYLIARALNPGKVLIPAPTFSEYERACRLICGMRGVRLELRRRENFDIDPALFIRTMKGCDLAFLCNPNNPTGRELGREALLQMAHAAAKMKCYLVIDEAFVDFCQVETLIGEVANNPYLIVLRSLTKFYALAGLRIGYGVFPLTVAGLMRRHKEPWTVNTLAQRAGIAALYDEAYRKASLRTMRQEKKFMENNFRALGITCIPSSANYYLIQMRNAPEAIVRLRSKGILMRDCSNFAGLDESYVRVAVKSRRDNTLLFRELTRLCTG
ncbi:MAG: threonine-phosphate decarboxylase CobD [Thermodesulfovibrionales bacterium]|jgi:threonine-phosphate decarboxylase